MKTIQYSVIAFLILLSQIALAQIPNGASSSSSPVNTISGAAPTDYTLDAYVNSVRVLNLRRIESNRTTVNAYVTSTIASYVDNNIVYTDGLGRPIQLVSRKASSFDKDIVKSFFYDDDNDGRKVADLLPYESTTTNGTFKKDAYSAMPTFYNSYTSQDKTTPFTKIEYDDNTLNREIKTMRPGDKYAGNGCGKKVSYLLNDASEIRQWSYNRATDNYPSTYGYWPEDKIMVTKHTNEEGLISYDYHDIDGKLIAVKTPGKLNQSNNIEYNFTYFIYDEKDRISHIITPKAVEYLRLNGWGTISYNPAHELCYFYDYDKRDNIIIKKLPGQEPIRIVYDANDRAIMIQTGELYNNGTDNDWLFTRYDKLGRVIATGKYDNPSNLSHNDIKNNLGTIYNTFFQMMGSDTYLPLTTSTSITGVDFYTINHYDDYTQANTSSYLYDNAAVQAITATGHPSTIIGHIRSSEVKHKPTVSYVRIFNGINVTSNWLYGVTYYDAYGLPIQTYHTNKNGGTEKNSTRYNFSGAVIGTSTTITNPNAPSGQIGTITTDKLFRYDVQGRLSSITHKINSIPYYKVLVSNTYDQLGKLKQKQLGKVAEIQDYTYRIWGDLESINKDYCTNGTTGRFFGERLYYDYGYDKISNKNISGMMWRMKGSSGNLRSYGYEYDVAGRLKIAEYRENNSRTSGWSKTYEDYSVNMDYDENGNIKHMLQMGTKVGYTAPFVMDDMTYVYENNEWSNKIKSVSDAITTNYQLGEFVEPNNTNTTDYTYDFSGSLTKDDNKNITSIKYNHFKKPYEVNFSNNRTIKFHYDAVGTLLSKEIINSSTTKTFDYISSAEYEDNKLISVQHPEGRIRPVLLTLTAGGTSWGYEYDYFVKDHLGNVRSVVTEEPDANYNDHYVNGDGVTDIAPVSYDPRNIGVESGFTVCERIYKAGSEMGAATIEEALFANVTECRVEKPNYTSATDVKASLVSANTNKIGISIMLKVAAGDKLAVSTDAYYADGETGMEESVSLEQLTNSLVSSLSGSNGYFNISNEAGNTGIVSNDVVKNQILSGLEEVYNNAQIDPDKPKSFLNYVVFDENMNLVEDQSGALQVTLPNNWGTLNCSEFEMNQSGYVFVFISNRGPKEVFYDNVVINHWKGKLLEENHYYPYGLTLTNKAYTLAPGNDILFSSKRLNRKEFTDASLDWYDFSARQYDPQIGRWTSADPLAELAVNWTPYRYAFDNPVNITDISGLYEDDDIDRDDQTPERQEQVMKYYDPTGDQDHRIELEDVIVRGDAESIWQDFKSNLSDLTEKLMSKVDIILENDFYLEGTVRIDLGPVNFAGKIPGLNLKGRFNPFSLDIIKFKFRLSTNLKKSNIKVLDHIGDGRDQVRQEVEAQLGKTTVGGEHSFEIRSDDWSYIPDTEQGELGAGIVTYDTEDGVKAEKSEKYAAWVGFAVDIDAGVD